MASSIGGTRVVSMQAAKRQKWLALVAAYVLAVQALFSAVAGAGQIERALLADGQVLCLSGHSDNAPDQPSPAHANDCCTWACNGGLALASATRSFDVAFRPSFAANFAVAENAISALPFGRVPFNPRAPPLAA